MNKTQSTLPEKLLFSCHAAPSSLLASSSILHTCQPSRKLRETPAISNEKYLPHAILKMS